MSSQKGDLRKADVCANVSLAMPRIARATQGPPRWAGSPLRVPRHAGWTRRLRYGTQAERLWQTKRRRAPAPRESARRTAALQRGKADPRLRRAGLTPFAKNATGFLSRRHSGRDETVRREIPPCANGAKNGAPGERDSGSRPPKRAGAGDPRPASAGRVAPTRTRSRSLTAIPQRQRAGFGMTTKSKAAGRLVGC